jgi:ankyrin repeat protein
VGAQEPDQHNVRDQTPLHLAASQGHIALMRRLLLAGANPELLDSVRT